ncbi:MAG: glycine cleavage system aminomethyltransferase GcvT [Candidatus Heimdallarchaeota archaeon]|nr:glycine cleavage system aminomethyltransferase GcvT [Candidatus Heimdallarchaeota archaeon]
MKTQLYNWHAENGDIVDFAGFKMPVMYSSIKKEHLAVRDSVGIFDVSHMGRMRIEGDDAEKFLNFLVPRDLSKTLVGRASYTFMLNEQGGFRDDLVFERIEDKKWLLVWNAGNLEKIRKWIQTFLSAVTHFSSSDITIIDISQTSAMFALQGPKAESLLKELLPSDVTPPASWGVLNSTIEGCNVIISGTGYTGEVGFEIIVLNTSNDDSIKAEKVWLKLIDEGKKFGLLPCGLGARDSLRLEAGYHLYGNDISETINPKEADLFFPPFIHIDKSLFIGKNALEFYKQVELQRIRIGLIAMKKGPSPRAGLKLYKEDEEIGTITSGGFSPLLNIGIGMGYINPQYNKEEEILHFKVRDKKHPVKITKFPLFDPKIYGKMREK